MLLHRGIGCFAVHRSRAELIGNIEDDLFDSDPAAEAEAEEMIWAPRPRLGIIEGSCPTSRLILHSSVWPDRQALQKTNDGIGTLPAIYKISVEVSLPSAISQPLCAGSCKS